MSDFANLAVGIVMVGSAAIGATRKMLERRRARRELLSRPVLGTETDEGTVVRVTGVVRIAEATLKSPIADSPCVVYRSRVMSAGGLVRRAFKPCESFAIVPFVLERDGDHALVTIDGAHALLDLPNRKLPAPRTSDDRERRTRFLLLHGIKVNKDGIFEEVTVEAGMHVAIAGLMMKDLRELPPEGETGYRDVGPAVQRLVGDVAHPLVIGAV